MLYSDSNTQTGEFLDQMYFGSSSPQITIPTRIIPRSRTVDSIFTNTVNEFAISGNLLGSVSDHLAQFLIYSDLKVSFDNQKDNAKTVLEQLLIVINSLIDKYAPLR